MSPLLIKDVMGNWQQVGNVKSKSFTFTFQSLSAAKTPEVAFINVLCLFKRAAGASLLAAGNTKPQPQPATLLCLSRMLKPTWSHYSSCTKGGLGTCSSIWPVPSAAMGRTKTRPGVKAVQSFSQGRVGSLQTHASSKHKHDGKAVFFKARADDIQHNTDQFRAIRMHVDKATWESVVKPVVKSVPPPRDLEPFRQKYWAPDQKVTVVGSELRFVEEGRVYEITGTWKLTDRFGYQANAEKVVAIASESEEDIRHMLINLGATGLGPKIAEAIVSKFGKETASVLSSKDAAKLLFNVPGIGKKIAENIKQAWDSKAKRHEVHGWLQQLGLRASSCQSAVKKLEEKVLQRQQQQQQQQTQQQKDTPSDDHHDAMKQMFKTDPYLCLMGVRGVSFKVVEEVGHQLGLDWSQHLSRGGYAMLQALTDAADEGKCFLTWAELMDKLKVLKTSGTQQPFHDEAYLRNCANMMIGKLGEERMCIEDVRLPEGQHLPPTNTSSSPSTSTPAPPPTTTTSPPQNHNPSTPSTLSLPLTPKYAINPKLQRTKATATIQVQTDNLKDGSFSPVGSEAPTPSWSNDARCYISQLHSAEEKVSKR
jgi:Holliday junction resolvasome RuvABC DNA-binding subunit